MTVLEKSRAMREMVSQRVHGIAARVVLDPVTMQGYRRKTFAEWKTIACELTICAAMAEQLADLSAAQPPCGFGMCGIPATENGRCDLHQGIP